MPAITINVDLETARAFTDASDEERRKLELILSLKLRHAAFAKQRSLKEIMDEMGAQAQARGLTPEILESILNEK